MKEGEKRVIAAVTVLALASLTCDTVATPSPTDTPNSNQPPVSENVPNQEVIVTSGVMNEITDQVKHDEIVASLPSDKPEAQGGDSQIKTFQIKAGDSTFDLAMYELTPDALKIQLPIELTDADGKTTQVVEGVALYTQSNHYDGSQTMERLIAIPVPTDTGVGVTWVYDEDGYPKQAGYSVDLSRAVFAYNVPVKEGSKLSFAPLTSRPEEIVRFGLPNPLTITIEGNPPSPMTVDVSLNNGIGTPVSGESTAVPLDNYEIQKLNQREVLRIIDSNDKNWLEMGYLQEFTKNGGVLTERTIEFNGQQVDAVGFRIGMTEIWVAKDLVDRNLEYYGGAKKQIGETIVPNREIDNWQYKIAILGAYIHANNMGFGDNILGFLQTMQGNTSNYVLQDFKKGDDGLIHIGELPPINPNIPVRMFIGNTTLTKTQAEKGKIFGGDPIAPYSLPYYTGDGWAGVLVDNNGGVTIAYDGALVTENGYGNDYYTDAAQKIFYATLVAMLQSNRNPQSSGFGYTSELKYITDTIVGPDTYTPLFIWDKK